MINILLIIKVLLFLVTPFFIPIEFLILQPQNKTHNA